jgi:hypothetical protein
MQKLGLAVVVVLGACDEVCDTSVAKFCDGATVDCPLTWTAAHDAASWSCSPDGPPSITLSTCSNVLVATRAGVDTGVSFYYDPHNGSLYGIESFAAGHGHGCVAGRGPFYECDDPMPVDPCAITTPVICNVLQQTGCAAGEKCTWIEDATTPQKVGHIGCAPDGTVARGASCMYTPPGANGGYDDCMKGDVCDHGACKQICDQNGSQPMCGAGFACSVGASLFGPTDGPFAAGVCDPSCDPLADNKFGKPTRTGSACGSNEGCYGLPDNILGTKYTCELEVNSTLFHRSACTTDDGCLSPGGLAFINGCAQGFEPIALDTTGSTQTDCISMCKPADCYAGHCGAGNVDQAGDSTASPRHQCNTIDSTGQFDPATANCIYEWFFDVNDFDVNNPRLVPSPTEDAVGYCIDNAFYAFDSSHSGIACTGVGQPSALCVQQPNCSTLALTGSAGPGGTNAGSWGCVNHTIGNNGGVVTLQGKPTFAVDRPRPLLHRSSR